MAGTLCIEAAQVRGDIATIWRGVVRPTGIKPARLAYHIVLVSSSARYSPKAIVVNRKQRRADGNGGKTAPTGSSLAGGIEQTIFGQALAFHQAGRLRDAEAGYREVLALNARHAGALCYLGLLAHQSGHSDAAVDLLKKAISSDGQNPELHYNLACIFSDCGRDDNAILQYRKAVDLKPDYPDALNNLSALLLLRGQTSEALIKVVQGLKAEPTKSLKSTFVMIAQSLDLSIVQPDADFAVFLAQALTEPWCRPRDISGIACEILFRDPVFARCFERAGQDRPPHLGELFSADELVLLSQNALLQAMLSSAPVTSLVAERALTAVRHALLVDLEAVSNYLSDQKLALACAIAQQCFINEYVFEVSDAEQEQIAGLSDAVSAALERDEPIAPLKIAVLASYLPLHSVAGAQRLAVSDMAEPLRAVVTQQISDNAVEKAIRPDVGILTVIDNIVSGKVREQYEQNPYPRWTKVVAEAHVMPVDRYIASRFPGVPYKNIASEPLDILIAGCGTGMHAIQRARQFSKANVLAIDLSLSSLSYAIRKTRELGLTNIRYAQADILALDDAQTFHLIDSSGVLHHLDNPLAGWRKLLKLLRPGGLMHIGLYSKLARAGVNVARAQLAKGNQSGAAAEIRRLRKQIWGLPDAKPLKQVAQFSDFYSISECRDLLFHVQEHQFSIPEIAAFLAENDLRFIGFETLARKAYLAKFPDDPTAVNLANWNAFENENPKTFSGMYQFWIQRQC